MNPATQQQEYSSGGTLTGTCLCGAVRFEIDPPFRPVVSCYCSECRRSSGNFVSATGVPNSRLRFLADEGLRWYTNELASHGFCGHCGSNLFWRPEPEDDATRIMAGCLQPDNGLEVALHICVRDKSDFHEIAADAPQSLDCQHDIEIPS
jgi:hypothetical protein